MRARNDNNHPSNHQIVIASRNYLFEVEPNVQECLARKSALATESRVRQDNAVFVDSINNGIVAASHRAPAPATTVVC